MLINFSLNNQTVTIDAPPDINLLTLLRDYLGLTGTKESCEIGECGACSVILDGRLVNSCLTLAPQVIGREVITIEGICTPSPTLPFIPEWGRIGGGQGGGLPNDMQENFIEYGAVQCGFCTPGMVLAGEALLKRHPQPTRQQIRREISGNLCRCTGYQQIVDAIEATAVARNGK